MNRADQALEPSMEDILASIRRIISDDDSGREEAGAQFSSESQLKSHVASQYSATLEYNSSYATSLNALAEEDVLDLTDELVFADKAEPQEAEQANHEVSDADENRGQREPTGGSGHDDHTVSGPASYSGKTSNHSPVGQPDNNRNSRDQGYNADWSRSSPVVSRPVWSRRELPESDSPSSALPARKPTPQKEARPQAKQREEKKPSPTQASSRPWSPDIQMPVPDHGPIPLLGQSEPRTATGKDAVSAGSRSAIPGQSSITTAEAAKGDASKVDAVAALAQTLAKSAVVSLDDAELSHAQNVDFEHLDESLKSEVSQKFADAISSNHTSNSSAALFLQPGMLDQMLRDDFNRQSASQDASSDDLPNVSQLASTDPYEEDRHFSSSAKQRQEPEKGHQKDMTSSSRINARSFSQSISSGQQQTETQSRNTAFAQAQPRSGAPASLSPTPSGGLEEVVREMLRPLLVQWLNENMPRILEDAIREEISMRGLPKLDMLS